MFHSIVKRERERADYSMIDHQKRKSITYLEFARRSDDVGFSFTALELKDEFNGLGLFLCVVKADVYFKHSEESF